MHPKKMKDGLCAHSRVDSKKTSKANYYAKSVSPFELSVVPQAFTAFWTNVSYLVKVDGGLFYSNLF